MSKPAPPYDRFEAIVDAVQTCRDLREDRGLCKGCKDNLRDLVNDAERATKAEALLKEFTRMAAEAETRLAQLRKERLLLVGTLEKEAKRSIERGYDFGMPNVNLYGQVIQLEAGIRELDYIVNHK